MKPIYFPLTYIPNPVGKALAVCFAQTAVYQVSSTKVPDGMRELAGNGILDIRIPVQSDTEKLDNVLKAYRSWASSHQGSEIAFLKAMADKIPFFDETYTSQIKTDIKKIDAESKAIEKSDQLFNALLFLNIAQEFDHENDRLTGDLIALEAMEEDLIKNLKGENDNFKKQIARSNALVKDDPGHYMTKERIAAWSLLMLQDQQASGMFITASRAVLDYLVDRMPDTEQIICFDTLPAGVHEAEALMEWRTGLMKHLEILATGNRTALTDTMPHPPEIPGCDRTISLTLYLAPGKSPYELFTDCIAKNSSHVEFKKNSGRFKNTLIGLIEK